MTLCHDLWCSLCHNQGHTKEDCRFSKSNQPAAANSHWVSEVPMSSTDDYYAEGADGHVYHGSMAGSLVGGPNMHLLATILRSMSEETKTTHHH
ncbi:hypothetical protein R1flu_024482 [Riccia fluitans]|uniref:Uncharacterized protein n=1 Tax=Riccia fluitans TaxID=41844 RepID=A0ABD1XVG2_9MARC